MENKSQRHVLDRIIEGFLFALVVLVPLIFLRHLKDSFNLPKTALAQLLICMAFLIWLVRMNLRREYTLIKSPLSLPLFVFLGIEVLSVMWAENIHVSLSFVLQDVAFGVLVVIVIHTVRTEKLFRKIILAVVFTAFTVALLGLLQYFKLDVLSLFPGGEGMIFSTIGHYNFLAAYLVTVVPSSLVMALMSKTPKRRVLFGFVFSVLLFTVLLTKSRGAWLGLLAALSVLLFGFLSQRDRRRMVRRKKVLQSLMVGATMSLLLLAIGIHIASQICVRRDGYTLKDWMVHFVASTTQRAVSTFYIGTGSAMYRRMIWIPTLHMIKENPLKGVGKNNFQIQYPKYTPEKYKKRLGILTHRGTKVHNEYLQIWAELGFIGLLAFLGVLFVVLHTGIRILKRYREKERNRYLLQLGILTGMIAVTVHSMVSNPLRIPTSSMHFWLFAGLTGVMYRLDDRGSTVIGNFYRDTGIKDILHRITTGLLVILMVLIHFLILRAVLADYYVKKGDLYRNREHNDEAIGYYQKAFSYGCRDSDVYRSVGRIYFLEKKYDLAIEQWQMGLSLSPYFPQMYYYIGSACFAVDDFERSEQMFLRALEIYRGYDEVSQKLEKLYLHWGAVLWDRGLSERAIQTYRRALRNTERDELFHVCLGHLYYQSGKSEEAIQEFEVAIQKQPDFAAAYKALGSVYSEGTERWRAVGYYLRYLELNPSDPERETVEETIENIQRKSGLDW